MDKTETQAEKFNKVLTETGIVPIRTSEIEMLTLSTHAVEVWFKDESLIRLVPDNLNSDLQRILFANGFERKESERKKVYK